MIFIKKKGSFRVFFPLFLTLSSSCLLWHIIQACRDAMMTMPWSGVCYTVDAAFCLLCCAWPTIPGRCIPTQSFNACRAVFGGTIIKYTSIYMMQFSIIRHVCPVVRRRRGRTLPPPSSPSTVSKGVMAIPLNYHRQASPYRAYIPTGTS